MFKVKCLAHLLVDHLAHPVVSSLYSFCANLLHSLIMWLMVSSPSPYSLYLLFCGVLSILALIWLVLMALSCASIRRDSVSLLWFPFLSQVQIFSYYNNNNNNNNNNYYYYYYYYLLLESCWCDFPEVRVTTSLLKSPGFFTTDHNNAVVWIISSLLVISDYYYYENFLYQLFTLANGFSLE